MSSPLLVAPLLAAHLVTPIHTREVRAHGIVVRATASLEGGGTHAELEIRGEGAAQRIDLGRREVSADALLASIDVIDCNFDGHPDVAVLRELGSTWSKVDVFLFDPKTHRYTVTSALSRALGSLSNASFDAAKKTITTHDIGPSNPSRVTYAVDGGNLRVVDSCRFINPGLERVGTLVRTRGATSTYSKLRLGPSDLEPCGI